MTLGNFAAFNSYLSLLIFPIIMIGFMSNVIAQANASFQRLHVVLDLPDLTDSGTITDELKGNVALKNVSVFYGQNLRFFLSYTHVYGSICPLIQPVIKWRNRSFTPFSHLNFLVMPVFDLTMNIVVFLALMAFAVLVGFALRSKQLAKKNREIAALEMEVIQVSAEILEVQKEYIQLESRMKDMSIPVISIKQAAKDDGPRKIDIVL